MKFDIKIDYVKKQQAILIDSNIKLNTYPLMKELQIINFHENTYDLDLNNINKITIIIKHKKQSTLKPVLDDIASSISTTKQF